MGGLSDIIALAAIVPRLLATSRRQALQSMTDVLARTDGVDARAAFDAILVRERLAGTGMSDGVAIPHASVKGIARPIGAFARLEPAQDFEALDKRPADLVFLLLSPPDRGGDHLKALARISRFLKHAETRERLRAARGADELYALFVGAVRSDAA
ncbi:MAG: PTS sugar transporter subunit IIA [Proteobacteria bacterium]|nr:PTS sugar transporter subunit IIA [Pseudomonadota bacterium]